MNNRDKTGIGMSRVLFYINMCLIIFFISLLSRTQAATTRHLSHTPIMQIGLYKEYLDHEIMSDALDSCSYSPKARRVIRESEQDIVLKLALIEALTFCAQEKSLLDVWEVYANESEDGSYLGKLPKFKYEIFILLKRHYPPEHLLMMGYLLLRHNALRPELGGMILDKLTERNQHPLYEFMYQLSIAQQLYLQGKWCQTAQTLEQGMTFRTSFSQIMYDRLSRYIRSLKPYCFFIQKKE